MNQDSGTDRWAEIIADAVEENLALVDSGAANATGFVNDIASRDPRLDYHRNVLDRELRAAWGVFLICR